MRLLAALLFAMFFAIATFEPALAQAVAAAPATVHIPWGDWLAAFVGGLPLAAILGLVSRVVGVPWLQALLVNDAVSKAVNAGLATVEGAVAGKALDLPIANEVARVAVQWLVDNEPLAAKWMGSTIGPKVLAQMAAVGAAPPAAMTVPKAA